MQIEKQSQPPATEEPNSPDEEQWPPPRPQPQPVTDPDDDRRNVSTIVQVEALERTPEPM